MQLKLFIVIQICYTDDIFVVSEFSERHANISQISLLKNLKTMDRQLTCEFGETEMDFLGRHIAKDGYCPIQDGVNAIKAHPKLELWNHDAFWE